MTEFIKNETEKATIYLDIDGVIFPFSARGFEKIENIEDTKWVERFEFYRPSVVRRLGSLSARIVLSSSRGISTLINSHYRELLDELHVVGALSIDAFNPADPNLKLDTIIRHKQGALDAFRHKSQHTQHIGTKTIWIDDQAGDITEEYPSSTLQDASFATVAPNRYIGLDHDHLDYIEAFIES